MSLNAAEIERILAEFADRLPGARLQRIDQAGEHDLLLRIRASKARFQLRFCVHPKASRLHLVSQRIDVEREPNRFVAALRRHLTGARIAELAHEPGERVTTLVLSERSPDLDPRHWRLVAELFGAGSNLLLVSPNGNLAATWKRPRSALKIGSPYVEPTARSKKATSIRPELEEAAAQAEQSPWAFNLAVEKHCDLLQARLQAEDLRESLRRKVKRKLKSLSRRMEKLEAAAEEVKECERYRQWGELLKANLHATRRGARQVEVTDYFDPDLKTVRIPLEPDRTPLENAESYFKRYRKARSGQAKTRERMRQTETEIAELEDVSRRLDELESVHDLERIAQEPALAGRKRSAGKSGSAKASPASGPRRFFSGEGTEILVGRNGRQNDELTFRIAKGNNLWFHVEGAPGSHVVVRLQRGQNASLETLLDAAHLALYYSRLRGRPKAEVDYTHVKYVRRMKKAPPGEVLISNSKTLAVDFDESRMKRLLDSAGETDS